MDWDRYKQICDTPNVFSRWMLEQTRELTGQALAAELDRAMMGLPVTKPSDHRGGSASDMFELTLTSEQVEAILRHVRSAVSVDRRTSGTAARGLGGFEAAWSEYGEFLEQTRLTRQR
ncbi:MAG: hypothetical protein P8Y69_01270 [Gammaproteobacteria bacterium]